MQNFVRYCDKVLGSLTKLASYVAGMCILFTAFIIVYEIVMRGVFHAPTEWVLEVSVYLILIAGFLGLSVTYAANAHVRVSILTARMPQRVQLIAEICMAIVGFIFFVVFLGESFDMVTTSYAFERTSPSTLRVPLFLPQLSLVIGSSLLILQFIKKIVVDITSLLDGSSARKK